MQLTSQLALPPFTLIPGICISYWQSNYIMRLTVLDNWLLLSPDTTHLSYLWHASQSYRLLTWQSAHLPGSTYQLIVNVSALPPASSCWIENLVKKLSSILCISAVPFVIIALYWNCQSSSRLFNLSCLSVQLTVDLNDRHYDRPLVSLFLLLFRLPLALKLCNRLLQ